jgi:large subunit ribosomal protein L24e
MTVDTSLTFAARRNIPVRYNRELVSKTLQAMRRVEEIRQKREHRFYKHRMYGNKARSLEEDRKLVEENQHLLPPEERYAYKEHVEDMEIDEDILNQHVEEEVSVLDFEEEEDEEKIEEPVIKSRLPIAMQKNKNKTKMLVTGGVEKD